MVYCDDALVLCYRHEIANSLRESVLLEIDRDQRRQEKSKEKWDNFWGIVQGLAYWVVISGGILLAVTGILTGLYFLGRWLQSIMPFSDQPVPNPPTSPPVDLSALIALCLRNGFIFAIMAGVMIFVVSVVHARRCTSFYNYFADSANSEMAALERLVICIGLLCAGSGIGIALILSFIFSGFAPYWNSAGYIFSFIFTILAAIHAVLAEQD